MQSQIQEKNNQTAESFHSAGSIFFTISILALANGIVNYLWISPYFPLGLGITQIIKAIAYVFQEGSENDPARLALGIGLYLAVIAGTALTGFFIRRQNRAMFIVGAFFYLLDTLLVAYFRDFLALAFHGYFLYRLWFDWKAIRKNLETPGGSKILESR